MCGLYVYDICKDKSTGATYFHGRWHLPSDSNVIPLVSSLVAIHLIGVWIKELKKNIAWCCLAYQNKMTFFQNNH